MMESITLNLATEQAYIDLADALNRLADVLGHPAMIPARDAAIAAHTLSEIAHTAATGQARAELRVTRYTDRPTTADRLDRLVTDSQVAAYEARAEAAGR